MFQTEPEAELKIPNLFGSQERTWGWVTFGANIPYFLAQISRVVDDDEELSMRENVLLGNERLILDLKNSQNEHMKLIQVSMLIPDHMRDTDHYTMGVLKEIWGCKETGARRYILSTGEKLSYTPGEDHSSMELMISL